MIVNQTPVAESTAECLDILPDLIVWTPEIDRMGYVLVRWIRMGLPGGAIYGQQRTGKTRACVYLARNLSTILGYSVAIVIWTMPERLDAKPNEREFYQEITLQSGCPRVAGKDIAMLRRRCHSHLVELANKAGSKRLVVIIDEAQNLTQAQYGYLIFCFNALEKLNVQPFFLMIGQPELQNASSNWAEGSGLQVLGRFFARRHVYRAVHRDEIKDVLDAFDEIPDGEDRPALQRVFPDAYANGWRLKHLASAYEEAVDLMMTKHNIEAGLRIPMQYLRASLLSLLFRVKDEGLTLEHVSSAMVFSALKESEFFEVFAYYVDASSYEGREAANTGSAGKKMKAAAAKGEAGEKRAA